MAALITYVLMVAAGAFITFMAFIIAIGMVCGLFRGVGRLTRRARGSLPRTDLGVREGEDGGAGVCS